MLTYVLGILAMFLVLGTMGYLFEKTAEANDKKRFPPPGRLIDVGGFKLHLRCLGEHERGKPMVILESGHGLWSSSWNPIIEETAQFTRVCAYDRAGYGWSERSSRPHTPQQVATELHALLMNAGESGPYVLVGHSLGGLFTRQYFTQYPEEVAGMVLVDALPERLSEYLPTYQQLQRSSLLSLCMLATLARFGLARLLGQRRLQEQTKYILPEDRASYAAQSVSTPYLNSLCEETAEVNRFIGQKPTLAGLGDRPLVVIKAHYPEKYPGRRGYTAESWKQLIRGWSILQKEFLSLSSQSRYVESKSDHGSVIAEEPGVVVEAIRWTVESAQGK